MLKIPPWLDRWASRLSDWQSLAAFVVGTGLFGMLGWGLEVVAAHGWAAIALFGIFGAMALTFVGSIAAIAASILLIAWRRFRPLPTPLLPPPPKTPEEIQHEDLVDIGNNCGAIAVSLFKEHDGEPRQDFQELFIIAQYWRLRLRRAGLPVPPLTREGVRAKPQLYGQYFSDVGAALRVGDLDEAMLEAESAIARIEATT